MGWRRDNLKEKFFDDMYYVMIIISTTFASFIGAVAILLASKGFLWLAAILGFDNEWCFVGINLFSSIGSLLIFLLFTGVGIIVMYKEAKTTLKEAFAKSKEQASQDRSLNGIEDKDTNIVTTKTEV
ncbi:MAG: hypothetical protein PHO93_04590 [Candidatus Saccharimonadaceae bacterium]|nr:hypothetical protein [Candidatus Saccharimonadaceae bacterium]